MLFDQVFPNADIYLKLARFFLIAVVGVVATRVAVMPLVGRAAAKRSGSKKSVHSLQNIAGVLGLIVTFIVALQAAEFGGLVTVLGAITAALTVAVGFGMRDQVANVMGGIFILTDNPFLRGDYLKVNDVEGVVKDIRLRYTVLNGGSSERLVVPNSVLTLNPVRNFSKGSRTKTAVEFSVPPGSVEKFEELALEAVEAEEEVLEKPSPGVTAKGIEEGETRLELLYWLKDSADVRQVRSAVIRDISEKADEAGVFEKEE
ncbi:MAG: mechanosensitive ion channel family protein [Candidatus Nanohaloarchaea archaeon]